MQSAVPGSSKFIADLHLTSYHCATAIPCRCLQRMHPHFLIHYLSRFWCFHADLNAFACEILKVMCPEIRLMQAIALTPA